MAQKKILPCDLWAIMPQETKDYLELIHRLYRQEISIDANELGWEIKLFSCVDHHSEDDQAIVLVIPKDPAQPIKLVTDEMVTVERRKK